MNPNDTFLFDGLEEVHSGYERGESYGLDRSTYARLAHCAITCANAGVEPSTIRRLANNHAGCDLTLYGKETAYTIRVEPDIPLLSLFVIGLDVKYIPLNPGHLVFKGENSFRDWFKITTTILGYAFENGEPPTLGDAHRAYEASENIDKFLY
jgi:hypothetical protein